jgi:N-acetylglucosamine-6-phosphate deacetylase
MFSDSCLIFPASVVSRCAETTSGRKLILTAAINDRETWVLCDALYTPYQRRSDWLLHLDQGRIHQMLPAADMKDIPPDRLVHIPGAMVAPGFIDLHIHGAAGRDFMDGSLATLQEVSRTLARHGTTSFLATTISASDADLEHALRGLATHRSAEMPGARHLGIHMEGPFLNPLRRGTHCAGCLRKAERDAFLRFIAWSENSVRRLTVAPEMDSGCSVIRAASELGIAVSLGHSDATEIQARAAVDAGATQATHTYNAMRPFHQREPGILGVALTDDRVYAEIIADGVHVQPGAIDLLLRVKGVDRIPLVTDGSSGVGMPDGRYPLGGKSVTVKDGECRDSEGHLAGSVLTLDRAVRNLIKWLDVPLHEALIMASATPARCMRMSNGLGIVKPGADADLVFLDRNLEVIQTMVAGRIVYTRPQASQDRAGT